MIPLTLGEIADDRRRRGRRRRRRPRRHRAGVPRQPLARAAAGCSSPSWASASTATTTPPARSRAARPRCSASRADRRARAWWSPTPQAALQELARAGAAPAVRAATAGSKVVAITGSQGKTTAKDMLARVLADARADGGDRGLVQQRAGPAAHRAAGRRPSTRYLVLEMGARGVGHLARALRDRAARHLPGAQRRQGAHRRVRLAGERSRWPRASSSRRSRPTASPCSTPTTRWWPRWPRAPRRSVVHLRPRRGADVRLADVDARRPRARRPSTSATTAHRARRAAPASASTRR